MEDIFEKYRKRLVHIGIFRSVVLGLALSFLAVGAAALVAWIAKAALPVILGLTIGMGAAVFLIAVPLFYVRRFHPTERAVAERLDALGLDERSITMYECRNDPSRMAALQREDAKDRISAVSKGKLKYTIALPVVLLLLFGAAFAAGTTAASVLSARGAGGAEETDPASPAEETFTVTYKVCEEGTGSISGEPIQKVTKGGFTEPVTAVPANGYRFAAWVDEAMVPLANQNNPRSEINVRADMTVYARFEKGDPPASGEDPDGELHEDGKKDPETGGDDQKDDPELPGQGETEGEGNPGGEPEDRPNNNNVIDGTQDYREKFDREALEKELTDGDLPDDLKDILGDYYDTLKP